MNCPKSGDPTRIETRSDELRNGGQFTILVSRKNS